MLLAVQIVIIAILLYTLSCIYLDEIRGMRRTAPRAEVEEIWMGAERRQWKRAKVRLEATYSYPPNADRRKERPTYTENICVGGAKIYIGEKLERGTPLLLELKLPDTDRYITASSEIAWMKGNPEALPSGERRFGTGVKFTYLKPADKERLSKFIEGILASQ